MKHKGLLASAAVAAGLGAGAMFLGAFQDTIKRVNEANQEQTGGSPSLGEQWLASNNISIFGYGAKNEISVDAPTVNQKVEIVNMAGNDQLGIIIKQELGL